MSKTLLAGRYELIRPLGHGAMAVVDLANDVELDRPVAVKRLAENLARDEDLRRRFLREGRLAARLSHPNVVRIFDVGEEGGRPFIAMEYVEGETLAEVIARRGRLPATEAAQLGVQMCAGLAATHAAGLVHRDVKPQNLLLGCDGVLKLGDFGIALGTEGTRLTVAGTVLGTAGYLAPEQARGEQVTAAADIYALGAVLCELLTGEPPRRAGSLAELTRPDASRAPELFARTSDVPPDLAAAVMACLAERPQDRPQSAAALARRLAPGAPEAETLSLPAEPDLPATRILAPSSRREGRAFRRLAAAGALVAAVAIGLVVALVATSGGGPAQTRSNPPAQVTPPTPGATPAQTAQNLAAWLLEHSRKP